MSYGTLAASAVAKQLGPERLLIPLSELPRLLSLSRAHLARLRASGKLGITVLRSGRKLLVRRAEVEEWVAAGMPSASEWAALRASTNRRLRVS